MSILLPTYNKKEIAALIAETDSRIMFSTILDVVQEEYQRYTLSDLCMIYQMLANKARELWNTEA